MDKFVLTGSLLKDLLKKQNMTLHALSKQCGVSEQVFKDILNKKYVEIGENTMLSIFSALGIYKTKKHEANEPEDEDFDLPPLVVEPTVPVFVANPEMETRELPTFSLGDAPSCTRPYQVFYDHASGEPLIGRGAKIAVYPFVQGHFDLCLARKHDADIAKLKIVEVKNEELFLTSCDFSQSEPGFHFEVLGGVVAFNSTEEPEI
ncbi:MAG: transcriptional regulator with XRE-family HTH domain [Parasphingorhabdus sp.]|jgi:transcriptional regulator with XRE-family HTH domain